MLRSLLPTVLVCLCSVPGLGEPLPPEPLSLTLIPPSPVSDQIVLDVRAAVRNPTNAARSFGLAVYLDDERPEHLLRQAELTVPPGAAAGFAVHWPTLGRQGKHRLLCVARPSDGQPHALRASQPVEVLSTGVRSTRRLGGAWVDICHHDEATGVPFIVEMRKLTDPQWRELVQAMHDVDQNLLVITMMFQNFTHRGQHKIETEGYRGKAYYPSQLYPGRMPIASPDPLETILSEADQLGMHVMPGVGCYAFFDFTPASLAWHKRVADELWRRYGHHRSFYGWYVSEEKVGDLGDSEERHEIADFFGEFKAHVRRLAPDKPIMLATNCHHLRGAEDAYRKLLPNVDILCPFGFHRMMPDDWSGEEAARLLQSLCDETGCHFWMDMETFVFRNGVELHPRSIEAVASDLARFTSFEKTLHYEFPGMMSGPRMSRQPGGPASRRLYDDYARFLREGFPSLLAHAARGKPLRLITPPDAKYPGGGPAGLVDGRRASEDHRNPQWLGFSGPEFEAVVDLGSTVEIRDVSLRCLHLTAADIRQPAEVRFAVSEDGRRFEELGKVGPSLGPTDPGPEIGTLKVDQLKARGRWIRIHAINAAGDNAQRTGARARLLVDEILVNQQ